MKRLHRWEQALLFQYVIEKGKPDWGKNEVKLFARLMNLTEKQSLAAYERARHSGYLDKTA